MSKEEQDRIEIATKETWEALKRSTLQDNPEWEDHSVRVVAGIIITLAEGDIAVAVKFVECCLREIGSGKFTESFLQ